MSESDELISVSASVSATALESSNIHPIIHFISISVFLLKWHLIRNSSNAFGSTPHFLHPLRCFDMTKFNLKVLYSQRHSHLLVPSHIYFCRGDDFFLRQIAFSSLQRICTAARTMRPSFNSIHETNNEFCGACRNKTTTKGQTAFRKHIVN